MTKIKILELNKSDLCRHPLCSSLELNLEVCLGGGQTFSWIRHPSGSWIGVVGEEIPVVLEQTKDFIDFLTLPDSVEQVRAQLWKLFRLGEDLLSLYRDWSKRDPHFFPEAAKGYPGIRLLDQCPVETLFAFICSQNNSIKRILGMVHHLKSHYGTHVANLWLDRDKGIPIYNFPSIHALASSGVEERLRALGFGYRAAYIRAAAKYLQDTDDCSVFDLRNLSYEDAREWLMRIPGIGPKVADCICLMSLNMQQVVPIDTHIWKVATSKYKFVRPGTPTPKNCRLLGQSFKEIFGDKAGWAHLVLFALQRRSLANSVN